MLFGARTRSVRLNFAMIAHKHPNPRALLNYARWHPSRPVDWRWRRAVRLVRDDRLPVAGADDDWTIDAFRYASARRCRTGIYRFSRRMIDLHEAHKLSKLDSPLCWELEARILAREDIAVVADKTGIAADTIRAFAATFFCVWPRVDARDYIHGVIGSWGTWEPHRVRDLWCHFGYTGGPFVLDAIIQHHRRSGRLDYTYLMEPMGPQRGQSEPERSINCLLRLMLLEKTDKTVKALAEMTSIIAVTEKELAVPLAEEAFDNTFEQAISTSLEAVPMLEKPSTPVLDQIGAA